MWKAISGFEGHYEINEFGDIKSLQRIVNHKTYGEMTVDEKILKKCPTTRGYVRVNLVLNKKHHFFQVHVLVAKAFIPNPENKPQVNHKNCIKTDNRVENLEWVTNEENYNHAKENGRIKADSELSYTILHKALLPEIITLLKTTQTIDVAKKYGVNAKSITRFLRRNIPRYLWPDKKDGWRSLAIGDPSIKEIVVVKP
jgi:hypothetical protein